MRVQVSQWNICSTIRAAHFLNHVRANDHAAGTAFFAAYFGERDAVVFFHDALVMVEQIFGNFRDGARAFRFSIDQFLFGDGALGFDGRVKNAFDLLDFLQRGFGGFDAAVVFLAGHHLFEQAVFGFGDFLFGELHFMLERAVGFVGLDLRSLVAIFADAVFPAFDVELVFFAVLHVGELRGFARVNAGFRGGDARIGIGDFLREFRKPGADVGQADVHILEVEKILKDLLHSGSF